MKKRVIYRVQKFVPHECPKCSQPFIDECKSFWLLLGKVLDGKKVPIIHQNYDVIVCGNCNNYTARVMIEECQVFEKERAELLLENEDFTLYSRGCGYGTHAQKELHILHPLGCGLSSGQKIIF